ncbi:MAG: hypothetical protein RBS02_13635, partial [Steroidobacteraceae bacterium]|nr:hypothetical protein [Steroidobacteraceae bacterium]
MRGLAGSDRSSTGRAPLQQLDDLVLVRIACIERRPARRQWSACASWAAAACTTAVVATSPA